YVSRVDEPVPAREGLVERCDRPADALRVLRRFTETDVVASDQLERALCLSGGTVVGRQKDERDVRRDRPADGHGERVSQLDVDRSSYVLACILTSRSDVDRYRGTTGRTAR